MKAVYIGTGSKDPPLVQVLGAKVTVYSLRTLAENMWRCGGAVLAQNQSSNSNSRTGNVCQLCQFEITWRSFSSSRISPRQMESFGTDWSSTGWWRVKEQFIYWLLIKRFHRHAIPLTPVADITKSQAVTCKMTNTSLTENQTLTLLYSSCLFDPNWPLTEG